MHTALAGNNSAFCQSSGLFWRFQTHLQMSWNLPGVNTLQVMVLISLLFMQAGWCLQTQSDGRVVVLTRVEIMSFVSTISVVSQTADRAKSHVSLTHLPPESHLNCTKNSVPHEFVSIASHIHTLTHAYIHIYLFIYKERVIYPQPRTGTDLLCCLSFNVHFIYCYVLVWLWMAESQRVYPFLSFPSGHSFGSWSGFKIGLKTEHPYGKSAE